MEDDEIERLAREELLREAQRASARAKIVGAQGWQKCAIPSPNKRFLQNTLMSTLSANKFGERRRRDSSDSYDREDRRKRRRSRDRRSSSRKKSKQRSSDKDSHSRKHRHSSSKDRSQSKKQKKSSGTDNGRKRHKRSKTSKVESEHSHHSQPSTVNGRTHEHGSASAAGPSRRNKMFLRSTPVVKRDVAT